MGKAGPPKADFFEKNEPIISKPVSNHGWIAKYLGLFLLGILIQPILESLLYEFSIAHIKTIDRSSNFKYLMHMFSYSGQGEVPFFIYVAIWAYKFDNKRSWEARTFINFMVLCFMWTSFHMFALKSLFHGSRPYLDDISLADSTIMETCSAEFGSPSGHSILATQGFLQVFWYFSKSKKGFCGLMLWIFGI